MAKVTGIVKIYVNGALYRSKPGAELKTGGYKRTAVSGFKLYGYTEEFEPAELDATLVHMGDNDVPAINALVDATLRFETDTGKTFLVSGAFVTEPCAVKSGGDMPLKMQGNPATEE